MTRPRPTPRPRPKPKAAEAKPTTTTEVTHLGHRMRRSVNPIGFEAATACQSGVGLVSATEDEASA